MTTRPLTLADRSRLLVDGQFANAVMFAYLLKAQYFSAASLPQNVTANYLKRKYAKDALQSGEGNKNDIVRRFLMQYTDVEDVELDDAERPTDTAINAKIEYVFTADAGVTPDLL